MIRELKCRDCKAPKRFPGCHATCKDYLEWKEKHEEELKAERKYKYLNRIGNK